MWRCTTASEKSEMVHGSSYSFKGEAEVTCLLLMTTVFDICS